MPSRNGLVRQLLAYAATPAERRDALAHWRLADVDDRQLGWLLGGGLGALLHYATHAQPEQVPAGWRERLLSEALTARIRHADRIDAARELIALCAREGVPVTLLKGISTSEQFYPAAHLRPMADVDVLVPLESCRRIQSLLEDAGYRAPKNYPDEDEQHHGPPLRRPSRDVWIEIHRSLLPEQDEFSVRRVFGAGIIGANSEPFTFHGMPALRLTPEYQLIYIASSWMRDLMHSIHASFLPSMFDAIFLLERQGESLDWAKVLAFTDDDLPTAALDVLLSYLDACNLCVLPAAVPGALARTQSLVGPVQRRLIHAMLDRYLIGSRLWRHPLPPPVAGRYSLRRQWIKRVLRRPYAGTA